MKYFIVGIVWIVTILIAIIIGKHSYAKKIINLQKKSDGFKSYYFVMTYWLEIKQRGKGLGEYFQKKNYKNIIIYGYGPIGRRVLDELKDTDINVCLVVDSNLSQEDSILGKVDDIDKVFADMILVTPTFAYNDIKNSIKDKVSCPIISLDEVVYSL